MAILSFGNERTTSLINSLESNLKNDLLLLIKQDLRNYSLIANKGLNQHKNIPDKGNQNQPENAGGLGSIIPGLTSLALVSDDFEVTQLYSETITNPQLADLLAKIRSNIEQSTKIPLSTGLQTTRALGALDYDGTAPETLIIAATDALPQDTFIALYTRFSKGSNSASLITVKVSELIDNRFPAINEGDLMLSLLLNNQVIYANQYALKGAFEGTQKIHAFEAHEGLWEIQINTPLNTSTLALWILGSLITSVLFTLVTYQTIWAKLRTKELNKKSSQLNTFFQNLPGAAYRILINIEQNTEETVAFLSDGFKSLSGYDATDITNGKHAFIDLIHIDDRVKVIQKVNKAVLNKQMYDFECRLVTKHGNLIWVWHRGRAVETLDNGLVYIDGLVSDITQRKQAEFALLEARSYAEAIVDTAIEAVILFSSDGTIKRINASAEKMFDYSQRELKGQNITVLMPDDAIHEHNNYMQRFLSSKIPAELSTARELMAKHRNGKIFPIELSIGEVLHQKKRSFVGLIRDISQQRSAEDQARLRLDQLAHVGRLNALGEMASGIAHEINQPLAAISLFAQAGKRFLATGNAEKASESFDKLSLHAQRAGAIIERIQNMANKHQSEKVTVDCQSLLSGVAELAEAEARIYDIEISLKIDENVPPLSLDIVQIQQVALNLIRNGMQAMRSVQCEHGKTIRLCARLIPNDFVEIAVIDSGAGVAKQVESELFEPFSSTKEYGMGMGLSISRAIVESHGGQLYFQNNLDYGATFFFSLPINTEK